MPIGHSEFPPELQMATDALATIVHQAALAHAKLRHVNAAHVARRVLPTAGILVVDAHDWRTDTGGVALREVHDTTGHALWRQGQASPTSSPRRRRPTETEHARWQSVVASIQRELTAAVDYVAPSECGWERYELFNRIELLYAVRLPAPGTTRQAG